MVSSTSPGLAAADPVKDSALRASATSGRTGHDSVEAVVKAVVVKSWGDCRSRDLVWNTLVANQASYGATPISIDYSDRRVCGDHFTLSGLESTGADVVIVSDAAGGARQFQPDEVAALKTYLREGHDVIGTFLTFKFGEVDNTALAPLFGLVQDAGWSDGDGSADATYAWKGKRGLCRTLFRKLPNPWSSSSFDGSQRPASGWTRDSVDGARRVALNAERSSAITVYDGGGYSAVYIASMPEYRGGVEDEQFLYNAITYARTTHHAFIS